MVNDGPKPFQTTSKIANSTQIVTAGVTIQSPVAFWVYSSVKIITVPAVTDSLGDLACQTTSSGTSTSLITLTDDATTSIQTVYYSPYYGTTGSTSNIYIISGVNSHAEAYFGGYDISGDGGVTNGPATGFETRTGFTFSGEDTTVTETATTYEVGPNSWLWIRSNGETFAYSTPPSTGTAVTFPTPFVYFPTRGTTGGSGEVANVACDQTGGNENYGYLPQSVIDHMAGVPAISTQFPGIESCLPAGPSILHWFRCAAPAPTVQSVLEGLTSSTVLTVAGGVSQTAPVSTSPIPQLTVRPPTITTTPQQDTAPTSPIPVVATPSPTIADQVSTTALSIPDSSSDSAPSQADIGGVIASAIASGIGATHAGTPTSVPATIEIISNEPFVVVDPTTIAADPALPIAGSTTLINNTPFVIISSLTTFPILSMAGQTTVLVAVATAVTVNSGHVNPINTLNPDLSLPGRTTILPGGATAVVIPDGITVPVNPGYSISGQTTVVSGVTEVVASGTQTVKLETGITVAGGNGSSGSIQFTGSAGKRSELWVGFIGSIIMLTCVVIL